jgi:hypothetical protein
VEERDRLEGRIFGSGGLLERRVLFDNVSVLQVEGMFRGLDAFSYEYHAGPEGWVARREGEKHSMRTSIFETGAGICVIKCS